MGTDLLFVGDVAGVGEKGARGAGGACAWVLDLPGLVGGVAGVEE